MYMQYHVDLPFLEFSVSIDIQIVKNNINQPITSIAMDSFVGFFSTALIQTNDKQFTIILLRAQIWSLPFEKQCSHKDKPIVELPLIKILLNRKKISSLKMKEIAEISISYKHVRPNLKTAMWPFTNLRLHNIYHLFSHCILESQLVTNH